MAGELALLCGAHVAPFLFAAAHELGLGDLGCSQSADAGGPQVPLPSDAGRRTLRSMPRLRTVASASAFVSSKMASCVGALLASKVTQAKLTRQRPRPDLI